MSLNAERAILGSALVVTTNYEVVSTLALLDFFSIKASQVGYQIIMYLPYSSNMAQEVKRKCIPLSIALLNGRIAHQAGYFNDP